MRHRRSLAATLALLLALAPPLAAYTIYLKDGSTIVAKEEYRIVEGRAIITLPNGTQSFIDADQIDTNKTRAANESNYGTALVLGDNAQEIGSPQEPPEEPTLSDLIANRQTRHREPVQNPVRRQPTPDGSPEVGRTRAGFVDLNTLPRKPYPDRSLAAEVLKVFEGQNIHQIQMFHGTAPQRPLLEITTNSEASIFRALLVSAHVLAQLQESSPGKVQAFEILMTTDSHDRAGQFELTPELASDLLQRRVDLPSFFVHHVKF